MLTTIKHKDSQEALRAKTGKTAKPLYMQRQHGGWPAASVWAQPGKAAPAAGAFSATAFSHTPIQAKLTIGQPGDRYEQEADRIADQVVDRIGNGKTETESSGGVRNPSVEQGGGNFQGMTGAVQRQCAECEEKEKEKTLQTKPLAAEITPLVQRQEAPGAREEEEPSGEVPEAEETVQEKTDSTFPIQRSREEGEDAPELEEQEEPASLQAKAESQGASTASPSLTSRLQATKGGGQPLSTHTRAQMEGAFGVDFSGVRIHTDAAALGMNRELRAQAFTHGRDIYFGAGRFQPESTEGRRLLAHELVHVGQQHRNIIHKKNDENIKSEKSSFSTAVNTILKGIPLETFPKVLFHFIMQRLMNVLGFKKDFKQNIYYSSQDCWQQFMGYFELYDKAAAFGIDLHYETIRFEYGNRQWKIELWKGDYGVMSKWLAEKFMIIVQKLRLEKYDLIAEKLESFVTNLREGNYGILSDYVFRTGAEIGIYTGNYLGFPFVEEDTDAATEYQMFMKFDLKNRNTGEVIFHREGVHWWLTGFSTSLKGKREDLIMEIFIRFPNPGMAGAFSDALIKMGYAVAKTYSTVEFTFDQPKSQQP